MDLVSLPSHWPNKGQSVARVARAHPRSTLRRGILVAGLLLALGMHASFCTIVVDGESMVPALQSGDRLLASPIPVLVGSIHDGDIVIIKNWMGHDTIVKRVFKMENEVVDPADRPNADARDPNVPYVVPSGEIYVLGDNSQESEDSRMFGPVPMDHVVAKVITP